MYEIRFLLLNWGTVISRNVLCKAVLQTSTVAVDFIDNKLIHCTGNE